MGKSLQHLQISSNLIPKTSPKMASRRGKYHHKLDELRGKLSTTDQAEFDYLCQWNPTYVSIQNWFAKRGHKISLNAIHHWWRANYPDRDESRIIKQLASSLERDFENPPYGTVLRLVITAIQVLCDHNTGKLASAERHLLMEKQLELSAGVRSLSMLDHLSKF